MEEERRIDPGHTSTRRVLRVLGPLIGVTGLMFIIVGIGSFFAAFGTFEPPRHFWCAFVGMPLVFVGIVLSLFGYAGAVARYQAGEVAPVAKDTFNYVADGVAPGVERLAEAVGEGLGRRGAPAPAEPVVRCHKCNAQNVLGARFCSSCGAALLKTKPCPACRELNDPDARFCDNCGKPLN